MRLPTYICPETLFRHIRHLILLTVVLVAGGASAASDTNLQRAAQLLASHQHQEALQQIQKAPASGQRSLISGVALLRLSRYEEALPQLADAEKNYPQLADHAAAQRAEALFRLKRYREASFVATAVAKSSAAPHLVRRMEKLAADALNEANDYKAALIAYQAFYTRYSLGKDSVDARYQAARCRDLLGDRSAALVEYRAIWLHHPASTQAGKVQEYLKSLEKSGNKSANSFTAEEQYQRALLLLAANQPVDAGWALAAIPRINLSDELLAQIELKSGQAAIKQRQYSLAERFLTRAGGSKNSSIRDEARLALARTEERTNQTERALARLLAMASERGPLADDALLEAGLAHKNSGRFAEAGRLLDRLIKEFPKSELVGRAAWEMAWSRYLSNDLPGADEGFRLLMKEDAYRERALYWHYRSSERQNKSQDAARSLKTLLTDYPFGFYSAWHRERTNQSAGWEPITSGLIAPELPMGSERILSLVASGLLEEARAEISTKKGKGQDKQAAPGLSRLQQLTGDYHGSIVTFHQNRPTSIDRTNLPYWALGYPRPYAELFSRHTATNRLSEGLVLSLAKAESNFRADVKSHAGAIGLMQLMPATARMTAKFKGKNYNSLWLIDPEYNIRLGTKHLRDLLDQYHQDTVYTLAAYNAGAGAVNRWRNNFGHLQRDEFIENIPYQETRDYVKKIVAHIAIYKALYRIQ